MFVLEKILIMHTGVKEEGFEQVKNYGGLGSYGIISNKENCVISFVSGIHDSIIDK